MNLQQLRYVVEIARTGSITQAARNLYMGQPNLSKSIKELEGEVGTALFRRTAKGVVPTKAGEDFLAYAQSITAQMDTLEHLYGAREERAHRLCVAAPRASYVSAAFARYAGTLDVQTELDYRELTAVEVVRAVASGASGVGVLRYQEAHKAYFESLCAENRLRSELLWRFPMVVLMSEDHPLAALGDLPYHLLSQYPQLVHGDLTPVLPPDEPGAAAPGSAAQIRVYDRAGQFDLLRCVRGSYMWVSPVPFDVAMREGLVQKPCRSGNVYCDALISRARLTDTERGFAEALRAEIAALPTE